MQSIDSNELCELRFEAESLLLRQCGNAAAGGRYTDTAHRLRAPRLYSTADLTLDPTLQAVQNVFAEVAHGLTWRIDGDRLTLTGKRNVLVASRL